MKAQHQNSRTIEFLKSISTSDWQHYVTFAYIHDVLESVALRYMLPARTKVKPIKITGLDGIYFFVDGEILRDVKMIEVGEQFEMYEQHYSVYERYMGRM